MKAKKYKGGGKVTKKMADEMDYKSKNEANDMAKDISDTLKKGYKDVNGFPRPLTAAQKSSLEKEMARVQKQLGKKPNYKYVGTELPEGDAPFEDDGMRGGGGMMPKYKRGGKMDFNKDGKITKADFILMAKANAKKKGKK